MDTPKDAYEEAIEKMAGRIAGEYLTMRDFGDIETSMDAARAAAEAIGLREMMEAQNEPFLPEFEPPPPPDPNYVFQCPIKYPGCVKDCGAYGCGN